MFGICIAQIRAGGRAMGAIRHQKLTIVLWIFAILATVFAAQTHAGNSPVGRVDEHVTYHLRLTAQPLIGGESRVAVRNTETSGRF